MSANASAPTSRPCTHLAPLHPPHALPGGTEATSLGTTVDASVGGGGGGKKPRLRWTPQLHAQFAAAVEALGGPLSATPKAILRRMEAQGLTLFHVSASRGGAARRAGPGWAGRGCAAGGYIGCPLLPLSWQPHVLSWQASRLPQVKSHLQKFRTAVQSRQQGRKAGGRRGRRPEPRSGGASSAGGCWAGHWAPVGGWHSRGVGPAGRVLMLLGAECKEAAWLPLSSHPAPACLCRGAPRPGP